jgi:hypothetical protein
VPPDDPTSSATPNPDASMPAKFTLGTAKFENVNTPTAGGLPPVDVHEILRDNLARAQAAGLNDLTPTPTRRSRRRRDYWFLLITANLFFGLIAVRSGPGAPIVFVSALAGMAIVSSALTWVMWFVMDDY